jgi:hypothetical protein
MPTKQDYDRAIKGGLDRIKKLEKEKKVSDRVRKQIAKRPAKTPEQIASITAARKEHGVTETRILRDIQGNRDEVEANVKRRDKAPSSFKDLKTGAANKHNVRELQLYMENSSQLYRQQGEPILKNLTKKAEKGTYDEMGAAKLYKHFADTGAKAYDKEFSGSSGTFSVADRNAVAKNFASEFTAENKSVINKGRRSLFGK